jgi:hypothetical protein
MSEIGDIIFMIGAHLCVFLQIEECDDAGELTLPSNPAPGGSPPFIKLHN